MNIFLDSSVRHITKTACMALSGTIENGILFTGTDMNDIIIFNNRIDFGRSFNPELMNVQGSFFTNFYKEYNNIVYRFGSNLKCSFFTKTIEYVGIFPPEVPDNQQLFNLIYPRFA